MSSMEEFIDYYELLGLSPRAEDELIKKAYRIKSKAAHPDTGGSQQEFLLLSEAYETLIDPIKRKRYDRLYFHMQNLKNEYVYHSENQSTQKDNSNEFKSEHTESEEVINKKEVAFNWRKIYAYGGSAFLLLSIIAKLSNNLPDDWTSAINNSNSTTEDPAQYELSERIYIDNERYMKFIQDQLENTLKSNTTIENVVNDENTTTDTSELNELDNVQSLYLNYLNNIEEIATTLQLESNIWETGTDSEILAFSEKEFQLWDDLLNEIYGVLKENLSTEEFIKLRELQREWIVERDRIAKVASRDFSGGTWEVPIYISTQANETMLRCYWLVSNYLGEL